MPLTISSDEVRFTYKSNDWQYQFNEIKKLGLLRKKKKYLLENGALIAVTAATYYCMIFSDLKELYYIIPAILCYTLIIIARFSNETEFVYFLFVKDIYQNEIRTRIAPEDRGLVGKQIDSYLDLQFERSIRRTA